MHLKQLRYLTSFPCNSPFKEGDVCLSVGAADAVCTEEAGRGGGRVLGGDLRLHPDHRGRLRGQDVSSRGTLPYLL